MKTHQKLDFVRKGLLMTLFNDDENLKRNFLTLFADSHLEIVRKESLDDDKTEYILSVKTKEHYPERYDRTFVVTTAKINDPCPQYKFQIVSIDEC